MECYNNHKRDVKCMKLGKHGIEKVHLEFKKQ